MIYFLVNNDYQLADARRHAREIRDRGMPVSLIEVPHALKSLEPGAEFESCTTFPTPLKSHGWVLSWPLYVRSARDVRKRLQPTASDVLFFYTEFELLNQMIAIQFKDHGARVFLLEDGGFGTYLPFSIDTTEPLNTKERVIALMTRALPRLSHTVFHKINDQVFPWLRDSIIDGIGLYRDVRIVRNIPKYMLRPGESPRIEPIQGKVIFMNERMYDVYQTRDQYMRGLSVILQALVTGFEQVVFKFHPREDEQWMAPIRQLIRNQFPSITFIEERRGIEELLAIERPEVLASYFSTTLLNLGNCGVEPLYLFHLFDELMEQKFFRQTKSLLLQWTYCFINGPEGAATGYRSGLFVDDRRDRVSVVDLCTSER